MKVETKTAKLHKVDGKIQIEITDGANIVSSFEAVDGPSLVTRIDRGLSYRGFYRVSPWASTGQSMTFDVYDVR
jgi:hypothetical protein